MSAPTRRTLDRHTKIGDLAQSVNGMLRRSIFPLTALLVAEVAFLWYTENPGTLAFALIALGTLVVFAIWSRNGIGLPIVPILGLQHLIAYGMPIAVEHDVLKIYPQKFVTQAGVEVLIFSCTLAAAWMFGMRIFVPAPPVSYALQGLKRHGSEKMRRFGFGLITIATGYELAQSMGLLGQLFALLPSGTSSVVVALMAAGGACGFFIVAMFEGNGALSLPSRLIFWGLLTLNCLLTAASYLLSPATATVISALIGLFWSRGRMPWRYLTIVLLTLSFLNIGKYTMRERYWNHTGQGDPTPQLTLERIPGSYVEWIEVSYDILVGNNERTGTLVGTKARNKGISLLERINNLQNLLFVIDAMETWSIPSLDGKTYTLIPPLLMPRILWPEKPRAHEGQVMLNVHFGRQELSSTFQTYIAWGLLPEAYGNFGTKAGALFLGGCLGLFFAWLENFTARKLLLSLEGLISFTVLIGMANSYEMVASVLVTTLFQGIGVLVVASTPFVERMITTRPPPPA